MLFIAGYDVTAEFAGGASVPIGRPIDNLHCYVLDAKLQLLPVGVPGELMVSGIQLARGYLKRPDLTAEKFIPNPFSRGHTHHDRLYRTGTPNADVGDTHRMLLYAVLRIYLCLCRRPCALAAGRDNRLHGPPGPPGAMQQIIKWPNIPRPCLLATAVQLPQVTYPHLHILCLRHSRVSSCMAACGQVKLRGFRVELGEVEAALTAVPGVALAVALVLGDPAGAQRLVAYVTPAAAPPAELAAALKGRLPAHMVPSVIVPLAAMPLLPNEKIDRKVLPRLGSHVARPVYGAGSALPTQMVCCLR